MRRGGIRGLGALVLAAAVLSVPAVTSTGVAAATATSLAIPLMAGETTTDLSSVVLPMGDLSQPVNTFWELFIQPTPGSSWTLRTPPGVASNGGLAIAVAPHGPITVGFLPSQLLHFSPVALSGDGGTSWSPGFLPEPLVAASDALATVPEANAIATDAVVATVSGQTVLTGQGAGGWHTLITRSVLARTVSGCSTRRITAVASVMAASGAVEPVLGVQCAQPGLIGVLAAPTLGRSGTSWTSVGPRLTGTARGVATVLRLESSPEGLAGLADVQAGTATALVGFWRSSPTAAWSQSAPLPVPPGWSVRASATGGSYGQGEAVLLASGAQLRVVEIAGPASNWVSLSPPPLGTEALVVRGALTDAFSVSGSKLRVWTSQVGATAWQRTQVITVPVPYGSSS